MLKVGVIGVGHLGRFHAEKYAGLPDVELVGVADADPERAAAVAARLGVAAYRDCRELLGRIDAASVVVPTAGHCDVAGTLLDAGVHVLLEKPMTRTLAEADALIAKAEQRSLTLQIGHLERFNPAWQAINGFVRSPLFIEADRVSPFPKRGTDVDVVLDLMIHDIDITLSVLGEDPVFVHAVGAPAVTPLVDIANARLEFPSGCVANFNASRISNQSVRKLRLFNAESYVSIDFGQHRATLGRRMAPEGEAAYIAYEDIPVTTCDALENEIRSFVAAVRNGHKPVVSAGDGRRALAVALRIMETIEARRVK